MRGNVASTAPTDADRDRARVCLTCPACRRAREKQRGLVYWFVKNIERGICPYCRAYERVYGRRVHEPIPAAEEA